MSKSSLHVRPSLLRASQGDGQSEGPALEQSCLDLLLSRQQKISQLAWRKPGLASGGSGLHLSRKQGLLGMLV